MAVVFKDIEVERSPQARRTVTDISTTPPRARSKFTSVLLSLLGPPEVPIFPVGTGPLVFGGAPSNSARERSFSDALLADLQKADDAIARLEENIGITSKRNRPLAAEEIRAKRLAIIQALPLDLSLRRVELEQEEAVLEREQRILPFIEDLKSSRVELDRSLAEKRRTEAAIALDLAASRREKELAAALLTQEKAAALRQNRQLVETALGGLDGFSKMIFLRDRLFPPEPEVRRVGRPGRRRRVITSF